METTTENDDKDLKVKQIASNRILKLISSILLILAISLAVALVVVLITSPKDVTVIREYSEVEDEVNLVALDGVHTGRMIATANDTEAVIDYRLSCLHDVPHNHTWLRCNLVQVGCATVKEENKTGEECSMEDFEFSFNLDRDGNFYTNDTEMFDPVRLAVALYSKHLRIPGEEGNIEEKSVERRNSSHAVVSYNGLTLQVTELPESALKKSSGKRRKRSATFSSDTGDLSQERRRRAISTGPILKGVFGQSLKNLWSGGPYMKVPSVFRKSGKHGIVRYYISLTNFELLLSSLPDIVVSGAFRSSSGSCTLNLEADFSQNKKCVNVIQSRIKVYFYARACVGFFCFARLKKDDLVSLDFTPFMKVALNLKPSGTNLRYNFDLKEFNSGTNSDFGGIQVRIDVAKVIGYILFGGYGFLGGFLLDWYFQRVVKRLFNEYTRDVPRLIDTEVTKLIRGKLPRPGQITIPSYLRTIVRNSMRTCNINSLTVALSRIGGLLQYLPGRLQPNKIPCRGNGLILNVHDKCMHDYGRSGSGDHLEVYCYRGAKRFCLSHELCPWRKQRSASCSTMFELATCSVGGLSSTYMATTWGVSYRCTRRCRGWWPFRRCTNTCSCSGSTYRRVQCRSGSVITS